MYPVAVVIKYTIQYNTQHKNYKHNNTKITNTITKGRSIKQLCLEAFTVLRIIIIGFWFASGVWLRFADDDVSKLFIRSIFKGQRSLKWPLKMEPTKTSETSSSSANLSYKP
jgi:hypothetical protein